MKIQEFLIYIFGAGIMFCPMVVLPQTYEWESWKRYKTLYFYGPGYLPTYTYLDLKNRSKLKDTPWIYKVPKRIMEEGWAVNTPLLLFVDCKNKQMRTVGGGYEGKWIDAKAQEKQKINDVCN